MQEFIENPSAIIGSVHMRHSGAFWVGLLEPAGASESASLSPELLCSQPQREAPSLSSHSSEGSLLFSQPQGTPSPSPPHGGSPSSPHSPGRAFLPSQSGQPRPPLTASGSIPLLSSLPEQPPPLFPHSVREEPPVCPHAPQRAPSSSHSLREPLLPHSPGRASLPSQHGQLRSLLTASGRRPPSLPTASESPLLSSPGDRGPGTQSRAGNSSAALPKHWEIPQKRTLKVFMQQGWQPAAFHVSNDSLHLGDRPSLTDPRPAPLPWLLTPGSPGNTVSCTSSRHLGSVMPLPSQKGSSVLINQVSSSVKWISNTHIIPSHVFLEYLHLSWWICH